MIASWWSPTTDVGVLVQLALTIMVAVALIVPVRRERSLVLLVVGMTMVTIGWYGIRSLH